MADAVVMRIPRLARAVAAPIVMRMPVLGVKAYLKEIEEVAMKYPWIRDACAIGIADDRFCGAVPNAPGRRPRSGVRPRRKFQEIARLNQLRPNDSIPRNASRCATKAIASATTARSTVATSDHHSATSTSIRPKPDLPQAGSSRRQPSIPSIRYTTSPKPAQAGLFVSRLARTRGDGQCLLKTA